MALRGIPGAAMSVRAIAYHIAGHELHHLKIIRERYLGERPAGVSPFN